MLMPSHNLPETAPDTIASHRASEPTGGNKSDTRQPGIFDSRRAKHQQFAASNHPISFYALVF